MRAASATTNHEFTHVLQFAVRHGGPDRSGYAGQGFESSIEQRLGNRAPQDLLEQQFLAFAHKVIRLGWNQPSQEFLSYDRDKIFLG